MQATDVALANVVMGSATEGWAIGDDLGYAAPSGLILHYTGGRWTLQTKIPNIELNGLAMLSASEGWAVGATVLPPNSDGIQRGILLHYARNAWQPVTIAASGIALDQVAMTAPTDGWRVGSAQSGASAVWRYNGSAWTSVDVPVMHTVNSIAPISASDVWALGFNPVPQTPVSGGGAHGGGTEPIFAHYDGRTWTAIQTPVSGMQNGEIFNLTMDAANDGWALGTQPASGDAAALTNLYLHYTGGQWQEVAGPAIDEVVGAVSMVSASDGWAVGSSGAILHYQNGAWNQVAFP